MNTALDTAADRLLAAYSRKARSPERIEETLQLIAQTLTFSVMNTQWSDALQAARDAHYREMVRELHRAGCKLIQHAINA